MMNVVLVAVAAFLIVQGTFALFPQASGIASIFAGIVILGLAGAWSLVNGK